jgi:PKD repeat protein
MTWADTGLTPGSTQSYRIRVSDPFGNTVTGNAASVVIADEGSLSDYAGSVLGDDVRSYWPLNESGGPAAIDWATGFDAVTGGGVTRNASGAVIGHPGTASHFDGSAAGFAATQAEEPSTDTFSVEAWVKTSTTQGGKIIGFGNSPTGTSSSYDRHLYMDDAGRIWFGVYPGGVRTLNTTASYNDGEWHHIVGTLGANGMALHLDGKKIAQRQDVTSAQPYQGYWRIGGDNLGGWPNQPSSAFLAGDIDEVAVYHSALSTQQVNDHYVASGRTSAVTPAPADDYGRAIYQAEPDLYWRLGESTGTTAADASQTGTTGTYWGSLAQGTDGLIAGTGNTAVAFTEGGVGSDLQVSDPRTYSLEAWFTTSTTRGGKLIGFGNQPSGLSSSYDRHVYMQDDGRLVFGTWTGHTNTITSDQPFNDGRPHHVVATQSHDGMKLYVDGTLVGTNPQTAAEGYAGFWRIGGDTTWGSSSPYFTGTLDEVAVYSRSLAASTIASHYALGSEEPPANTAPTARFTATTDALGVAVDGATSSDADGALTAYAWDFGDGATANGATATHTYAKAGTYPVTLTVTDEDGATHAVTQEVTVAPANQPPTALFTHSASELTVTVDASASTDSDGTVATYAWDFGDGATATGATASHTYAANGAYPVRLTVTDDDGAVGSMTQSVAVQAPGGAFATDTFERSVSGGLGTADAGGTWTTSGAASKYSVANGAGMLTSPTAGAMENAYLSSVSSSDTDAQMTFALQQASTGSGAYVSLLGRTVGTEDYRARARLNADGTVALQLMRGATSLRSASIPGLTHVTGERMHLRVQVFGTDPTTIRAKVWKAGQPEPAAWQLSATDATASLQVPGAIGVSFYLGGTATVAPVTVAIDDLVAKPAE